MKCCGFGHRDASNMVDDLAAVIEHMAGVCKVTEFYTGGMGEFDSRFCSAVRTVKKYRSNIKLILVKPYFSNELNTNGDYYMSAYDEVIVPSEPLTVHPKAAITKRNRLMVEMCDYVIGYVKSDHGGAYEAIKYAKKLGKKCIDLQ